MEPDVLGLAGTAAQGLSVAEELSQLAVLRDKGVLTEAEFESQKRKLLNH